MGKGQNRECSVRIDLQVSLGAVLGVTFGLVLGLFGLGEGV